MQVMLWRRTRGWSDAAIVACGTFAVVLVVALMALPGLWYIAWGEAGSARHPELMAALLKLGALDASWERAALRSVTEPVPPPAIDHAGALARITQPLDVTVTAHGSPLLQRDLPEVVAALREKAGLVAQLQQARAISQKALQEVLAMESELAALVREAWRDAPERQRLVAVDNVVTQTLADAQRYGFTAAASQRKNLETSAADLRDAAAVLPEPLNDALLRLHRHVEHLLQAKPVEQKAFERVRFHNAGPRVATLIDELQREAEEDSANRARYRIYLGAYFLALLVLWAYVAARVIRREVVSRARSRTTSETVPDGEVPAQAALSETSGDKPQT
jgi:hypothetical protein